MSVKVMALVWDCEALAGPRLLAMLALADFADADGSNVFPSVETLAKKLRLGERQVQRLLRDLESGGWILCTANEAGGRYKSRQYRITVDKLKGDIHDTLSTIGKGDIGDAKGCHPRRETVTSMTGKGDTAMSPNPSIPVNNHHEPIKALSASPPDLLAQATTVLEFLNEKTGRKYRARDGQCQPTVNLRLILDRLKTGVSVQDCKTMIARKYRQWAHDDKMWPYLRPSTLFRASNFEQYLGECTTNENRQGART